MNHENDGAMVFTTLIEQLMLSTVRINCSNGERTSIGTGFIIKVQKEDKYSLLLVTNKHVIQNYSEGILNFIVGNNGNPEIGKKADVRIHGFNTMWILHPDPDVDIAIMPIVDIISKFNTKERELCYRAIDLSLFPTFEDWKSLDAFEEIIFIGYPNGILDTSNYLPIIRKGTTATHPNINYCGKPQFLIDSSVFPGSSGSPVFLYNQGWYSDRKGNMVAGKRLLLLGILGAVYHRFENGEIVTGEIPAGITQYAKVKEFVDLGIVYKSTIIRDFVMEVLKKYDQAPVLDEPTSTI